MLPYRTFSNSSVRFAFLNLFAICAFGAPSIATVTSGVAFSLDGHAVNAPGVTTFPVMAGDTVGTFNGPAVLTFHDGSIVKLANNSSVKVDGAEAQPKVVLLGGALDYKLIPGSPVTVTNLDKDRKQTGDIAKAEVAAPVGSGAKSSGIASALVSPKFLITAGSGSVGLAAALYQSLSGGSSTSSVAPVSSAISAAPTVRIPPVSKHL